MQMECETSLSSDVLDTVRAGMRRHTESCVPWEEYEDLAIVARADDRTVAGAAIGETGRGWLHISVVWVDEQFRRQAVGRSLVEQMEVEAMRRGCRNAYLDTFSYQAPAFYEKLGYQVFGKLDDYPPGYQRFYMRKQLT